MPFPNAQFDLVVSNIGINNFPDAGVALRECRRVAKTGARLVLTTNAQGHFAALYALLDAILGESGLEAARDALRREQQHRHSEQALTTLLVDNGFRSLALLRTKLCNAFRRWIGAAAPLARKMVPRWLAASRRRRG